MMSIVFNPCVSESRKISKLGWVGGEFPSHSLEILDRNDRIEADSRRLGTVLAFVVCARPELNEERLC